MMQAGEKVERATIVNAMQRCNDADQAILDHKCRFEEYMKKREVKDD